MYFEQIRYIALLGPREEPQMINIPQEYLNSPMLRYLGYLPQTMFHFIYGTDQFSAMMSHSLQFGYCLLFVHPDISKREIDMIPWSYSDTPIVLLMCTDDRNAIETYNLLFNKATKTNVLCITSPNSEALVSIPCNIASTSDTVWKWFYDYAQMFYKVDYSRCPFSVPLFPKDLIDTGYVFSPSRVNTLIINALHGNWGYEREYSKEEMIKLATESSKQAFSDPNSDIRQNILVEQILRIRAMENLQAKVMGELTMTEEQYRAPLVIAAPYTSLEMRRVADKEKFKGEELKAASLFEKLMDVEYTKNYTINKCVLATTPEELLSIHAQQAKIVDTRMTFVDNVASLHCSMRFSPYFRMPILGKNINAELSFVGIKNVNKVAKSKSRNKSIRKAMERVGKAITSNALCKSTENLIKNDCAQIVALTDLPIEWMMLDGVPLGFSHDVCRLPETPIQSLLAQYEESLVTPYVIPKEILKKTLVVYGNDEPAFVMFQDAVEMLKGKLGFQTRRCLSKKDFFDTVEEVKPDLLIVDSHGSVDIDTHQSYLYIGEDTVMGEDIINSNINPRLVFLSACNTFTTYTSVGTIANAFFQKGANAVTTAYMPLEIMPATTLYCRLLVNLERVAKKNIHKNWLSFMSHLLRTSYIHAPMTENIEKLNPVLSQKLASLTSASMIFGNRRKIYKELASNDFTRAMGAKYDNIIPHYLMYSTLGRADLIRFESFLEDVNGSLFTHTVKDVTTDSSFFD